MTPPDPEVIAYIERRLNHGKRRMDVLETLVEENRLAHQANATALKKNMELTEEVRDIIVLAKSFFVILGWVGRAIKWTAAVGAGLTALWALFHNTPGPGK